MKEFSSSVTIKATPETIWGILTDASAFPTWEPNVTKIDGTIAPGETIRVHTKISPNRAFPVKVSEFVPGQKMAWSSGMPLGLFKGERTFTLAPQGDGTTRVTTREVFSGPMMFLIGRTIPDLTDSFDQFSEALKARAEKRR